MGIDVSGDLKIVTMSVSDLQNKTSSFHHSVLSIEIMARPETRVGRVGSELQGGCGAEAAKSASGSRFYFIYKLQQENNQES